MLVIDSEFNKYIQKISAIPLLTDEQEKTLAERWFHHQDIEAAQQLVTAYLRLVTKVVLKYQNYGLPLMDLVSEGSIGLMKAVKNFNPTLGFRVATYAMWWIKSAIQEYILKSWSLVKIGSTTAQRKLFFNLRKLKNKISNSNTTALPKSENEIIADVAKQLAVTEKEAIAMDNILCHRDLSLNMKVGGDDDTEMHEGIESSEESHELQLINYQEKTNRRALLHKALLSLDERYRQIFIARKMQMKPETLKVLSERFGISQERVRQMEKRGIEKIKQYIKECLNTPALSSIIAFKNSSDLMKIV